MKTVLFISFRPLKLLNLNGIYPAIIFTLFLESLLKTLSSTPEVVKKVHFRPSVQRILLRKYAGLSASQREQFYKIIEPGSDIKHISPLPVETAIEYYQFLDIKSGGKLSPAQRKQQMKLLSVRAKQGSSIDLSSLPPLSHQSQPDRGHDSYSMFLSHTYRNRKDSFQEGGSTQLKLKSSLP